MSNSKAPSAASPIAILAISCLTIGGLAGCDAAAMSADIPTCAEYAAMGPETGIFVEPTSAQLDAMDAALLATGYEDDAYNRAIAHTEIIAYCNIYDGVAGGNETSLITTAVE